MKKIICLSLILMTLLFFSPSGAQAQSLKRIAFAKGKSSATVKGNTGEYGVTYVVRARSGQKLVLTLSPTTKVGIKVEGNGRYGEMVLLREERGGTFVVGLEETGDYTIFIGSTEGKPTPFTLTVKIERMTDI
jgi:hypothetical protein